MSMIWLGCWIVQALAGHVEHNAQRLDHQQSPLTLWQYVGTPEFWNRTLQN